MKYFLLLIFVCMFFGCSGNFSCYYAKPQKNHACLSKCLKDSLKCKDDCDSTKVLGNDTRYQHQECLINCDKVYGECFSACE